MSNDKFEIEQDASARVLISRLKFTRISLLFLGAVVFFIYGAFFRDKFAPSRILYSYGLRISATWVFGQIFFLRGSTMFLFLLIRRLFFDDAAVYLQKNCLYYVNPIKYIRVPISEIRGVKASLYPTFVQIETNSGILKYITTMVTDLSASQTAEKILVEIELLNNRPL